MKRAPSVLLIALAGFVSLPRQAFAATGGSPSPTEALLARARRLVGEKGDVRRRLGLAEMLRAAGRRGDALRELEAALDAHPPRELAVTLRELLCWRMLPIGASDLRELGRRYAPLTWDNVMSDWRAVFGLYIASKSDERASMRLAARALRPPEAFPGVLAEKAHFDLLVELGLSRTQAGLEVITHRSFQPLYALRDLDRALSRESGFLRDAGARANADRLQRTRDTLRAAYLAMSRSVVERLFALKLAGKTDERDKLLARVKKSPWLTDREALANALAKLTERQAWTLIVRPLLAGDLRLLDSPPDLDKISRKATAAMHVRADRKTAEGGMALYAGAVEIRLEHLTLRCDSASVVTDAGAQQAMVIASGRVAIAGLPGLARAAADRFTFSSETGKFTLAGDVRLEGVDGTTKLRACTIELDGKVLDRKSLLKDFEAAWQIADKLALLPRITRIYTDDELPPAVRYLLALDFLRTHLTWHAPPVRRLRRRQEMLKRAKRVRRWDRNEGRWENAHQGEPWMLELLGKAEKAKLEAARATFRASLRDDGQRKQPVPFYWRLSDPEHPDVERAAKLLERIRDGELHSKARRWLAEVRRNNTVTTFDIPGGCARDKQGAVVMDVRNAETVAFKIYRVRHGRDFLGVTDRIGRDFMYRDYGLDDRQVRLAEMAMQLAQEMAHEMARLQSLEAHALPSFDETSLIHSWRVGVAELEPLRVRRWRLRHWDDDYGYDDESEYFDDRCRWAEARIRKDYAGDERPTSAWVSNRVVRLPVLAEPGGYVLVAEANGQKSYAPILVEPLSLTLRRCRDGVFVLVSNAEANEPVAGARILGSRMAGPATTDAAGAAFARIYAAGDRAIVAEKDGRFAIGGFGRLFEGLYVSHWDLAFRDRGLMRQRKLRRAIAVDRSAQVYADRHVVAAYTDRPTYRPGQEVHFKLIVRRLKPAAEAGAATTRFRAADFELASNLELPKQGAQVRYQVVNPRGRAVASGTLPLNDYGTAAGKLALLSEAAVGAYALRATIDGRARVVPGLFAVKYYRRPNFTLKVSGVPAKLTKPGPLALRFAGRYYFGKALAGGRVDVRLVRSDHWKSLADGTATLDAKGTGTLDLALPHGLADGKYFVIATLTDDSGRAVSSSHLLEVSLRGAAKAPSALAALPRFVPFEKPLEIETEAGQVVLQHGRKDLGEEGKSTFDPDAARTATVRFPGPGWYTLTAGDERTALFAYGGTLPPHKMGAQRAKQQEQPAEDAKKGPRRMRPEPRWVDLTRYRGEEDGDEDDDAYDAYKHDYEDDRWDRLWDRPEHRLLALFDRYHAEVGGKLRLLVHVPYAKARLLFTMEGRTIAEYVVTATPEQKGSRYHVVELPITRRLLPNFYLRGRILWGRSDPRQPAVARLAEVLQDQLISLEEARKEEGDGSEDPRWCRIDVVDPNATPGGQTLKVAVQTDRAEYRPGQDVAAVLRVTDLKGAPREAEVSLAAVDESIFAFGEDRLDYLASAFSDPHPPRRYFRKTWRSTRGMKWSARRAVALMRVQQQMDALAQAAELQDMAKALDPRRDKLAMRLGPRRSVLRDLGEMPAASLPLARLRTDFRETAVWQPQLRTGPDGVVATTFKLPDSLTAYRLTAAALTKQTEIGVGRGAVRVRMPLAVQLFLPRFAVEKDRLMAVALIHNTTPRARTCAAAWEIEGARVDVAAANAGAWRTRPKGGREIVSGRVTVPAGGTARVGLWIVADRAGTARLAFRAADDEEADAEERVLPVHPLGRERDVALSGSFTETTRLSLPAGFVARDLTITLARAQAQQATEGLEYLVEYPYGCVEQTMSRFLPAVMVKHATRRAAVALPPAVERKLPDVLAKGLARLYNFQHADGGWGWWQGDKTNDQMTVYVLYGLARCRLAGTAVDADVLRKGFRYLEQQLRDGHLARRAGVGATHASPAGEAVPRPYGADLEARAWLVLTLAGVAGRDDLAAYARPALERALTPEARCTLALACHNAGLGDLAERFFVRCRPWRPDGTGPLALKLSAQIAFAEPLADCNNSAAQLLARRKGHRWESTRATSWAIEALAEMLRYARSATPAKSVSVRVAGITVLDVKDPADLRKLVHSVRVPAELLVGKEAVPLELAVRGTEPVRYVVSAVGTQRLDRVEPIGTDVTIRRDYTTLDGKPLGGKARVGDVIAARVTVELAKPQEYFIIEDRRPAGFEFAHDRIVGPDAASAAHVEFRDDRVCVFHTRLSAGRHEIVYHLRAETPGLSHVLPGAAYPMYDEKTRGETAAARLLAEPQ